MSKASNWLESYGVLIPPIVLLLFLLIACGLVVFGQESKPSSADFPSVASDQETFLYWLKLSSSIRIYLPSGNSVDYSGPKLRKLLKEINCYERVPEPKK